MSYRAEILADSIGPHGQRLTTFELCYPHIIHKEVMTHRAFSRSFMSSRAVPPEAFIEQAANDPFVPDFHGRVKGMGTSGALHPRKVPLATAQWLSARDAAVAAARIMALNNVAKSDINPLLEPFLWMRGVVSATDWSNFYALRAHSDARKEFQILATMMQEVYQDHDPRPLSEGEWHIPTLSLNEKLAAEEHPQLWARVSAGRLARISFDRVHMKEPVERSLERADSLAEAGHMSPFEHQACCLAAPTQIGNFRGFKQMRKLFEHEDNFALLQNAKRPA